MISLGELRCGSGGGEPKDPALVGPVEREFRQISQDLCRQVNGLAAFEDRLCDVRCEPGQRQDAADGTWTQLLALGEFRNGTCSTVNKILHPAPCICDQRDKVWIAPRHIVVRPRHDRTVSPVAPHSDRYLDPWGKQFGRGRIIEERCEIEPKTDQPIAQFCPMQIG